MAFLTLPTAETTTGRVQKVLAETRSRWGYEPNIVRALALRPELLEAEDVWSKALMYSGRLPRLLKEEVATTVSAVNECDYCATSHAYAATKVGASSDAAASCARMAFERFPSKERAALEFAKKAASDMRSVTKKDVDALRTHFGPDEIVELVAVVASFMMYNTFVTALGLEIEPKNPIQSVLTRR